MTVGGQASQPIDFRQIRKHNRQCGNCGNVGDIIKHAGLLALVEVLVEEQHVDAVDAFGFLMECPPTDRGAWQRDTLELEALFPGYRRYREAQADQFLYRCSPGILVDALGDRLGRLYVAETHDLTRKTLKAQAAASPAAGRISVSDNAYRLSEHARPSDEVSAFIGLIDPFVLTPEMVTETRRILELWRSTPVCLLEVFTFEKDEPLTFKWPSLGVRLNEPFAQIANGPFQLAAYGWGSAVKEAKTRLNALGWQAP